VRLEVRRLLRNRRTMMLALIFPVLLFLGLRPGLCVWIGSLLFAAFGVFAGYLLPTENVAQVLTLVPTGCTGAVWSLRTDTARV
jgi:hypothetical protein